MARLTHFTCRESNGDAAQAEDVAPGDGIGCHLAAGCAGHA
jgi:hypothetical protein